jgi:hypothetical protein
MKRALPSGLAIGETIRDPAPTVSDEPLCEAIRSFASDDIVSSKNDSSSIKLCGAMIDASRLGASDAASK